jgi:hypothetical protein
MTDWLARALALSTHGPGVPKPSKLPKPPPEPEEPPGFGSYASFGTGAAHRLQTPPPPAADGPVSWREALLALPSDADPCPGWRPDAWARVQAHPLDFIDRQGAEAERLGWMDVELFGVHPVVGVIQVDHCGALMLTVGGRVESVEAEAIRYAGGLVYRRSGASIAAMPVWDFRAGSTMQ